MSYSILLPSMRTQVTVTPTSPDPTPLRMLAFSVAEAALSSDPNSPLFLAQTGVADGPRFSLQHEDWDEKFQAGWKEWNGGTKTVAQRRGKVVWDVLEKAKERKDKNPHNEVVINDSPPISPSSYSFTLPADSQLAASIARHEAYKPIKSTKPKAFNRRDPPAYQSYSVEPSPTRSTFSGLDQTRPPPIFIPRLTAEEFVQEAERASADLGVIRERRKSSIEPLSAAALAEHDAATQVPGPRSSRRSRLPSLQQIQAKVSGTSRLYRSGSVGALPTIQVRPRSPRAMSTDSVESEIIQTPVDEIPNPLRDRRLALQIIVGKRPPTPPSPVRSDARLSSFLRERTNGRLATSSKMNIEGPATVTPEKLSRPILRVTPPSMENRPAVPPLHLGRAREALPAKSVFPMRSGFSTPTESRFILPYTHLSTPPSRSGTPSPTSPTGSIRSVRSGSTGLTGSPTPSMPIITCTPAPAVVLRDGLEQDSDDGSDASGEEFVVFDGGEAEEREREVRGRVGMAMREKLSRRRASDSD